MAVRITEARIPLDFSPNDLGQAHWPDDGDFSLICDLTSPILYLSKTNYYAFIENQYTHKIERIHWRLFWDDFEIEEIDKRVPIAAIDNVPEAVHEIVDGNSHYQINVVTRQLVVAELFDDAGAYVARLFLRQSTYNTDDAFEVLTSDRIKIEVGQEHQAAGAFVGDRDVMNELVNKYRDYVFTASMGLVIPEKVLAVIVYTRMAEIYSFMETIEEEFNNFEADLNSSSVIPPIENIGRFQMKIQNFAMALDIVPFQSLPLDELKRPVIEQQIMDNILSLPNAIDIVVDIFNVIRFPKTNLKTFALWTQKLFQKRWSTENGDFLLSNTDALAILATEVDEGSIDSDIDLQSSKQEFLQPSNFGFKVAKNMRMPAVNIYFDPSKTLTFDPSLYFGVVIIYGRGAELGNFGVFAEHLKADLEDIYSDRVTIVNIERKSDLFDYLSAIANNTLLKELHIFSHSIGAGLFLGYGDPECRDSRKTAFNNAKSAGREISFDEVVEAEIGAILTDDLIKPSVGALKNNIQSKFSKNGFIKIWGCNSAVFDWRYSDTWTDHDGNICITDLDEDGNTSGNPDLYWEVLNTRNTPKDSIAQSMANYFCRTVYGAESGSHIEVYDSGNWITTDEYRNIHGNWPNPDNVKHRLEPDVGIYVKFEPPC